MDAQIPSLATDRVIAVMATRIRDRAIRRAGELLQQIEPKRGANQNIPDGSDRKVFTRTDAARDAGMSQRQQVTALRIAAIPQEEFDRQVDSNLSDLLARSAIRLCHCKAGRTGIGGLQRQNLAAEMVSAHGLATGGHRHCRWFRNWNDREPA